MDVLIDLRVAELLCSRLCHELANPMGAVSNGVELIAELGESDSEALSLIGDSARAAANRLQFYRIAYGQASGTSADLTLAEAKALASGVIESNRIRLDWPKDPGAAERRLGREPIKLLLNLLVLAGEALPRGGIVSLALAAPAGTAGTVAVAAAGEQAGLNLEALAAFHGQANVDSLTARTAHAYFTGRLGARLALPLALVGEQDRLVFQLNLA